MLTNFEIQNGSVTITFSKLDKDTIDLVIWKITQIEKVKRIFYKVTDKIEPSNSSFNGLKYFKQRCMEKWNIEALFNSGYYREIAIRY